MSVQLLRRAWDALDAFKQAYPENWHEEDQQVMDDLIKADRDLSGVGRKWVGLSFEEAMHIAGEFGEMETHKEQYKFARAIEARLKEKNGWKPQK